MDYEHLPGDGPLDETDVSLRAYLAKLPAEHLAQYDPAWSDEQVLAWDGNFRSDGALMLVCCERDIDVVDFRQAVEQHLAHRPLTPSTGRILSARVNSASQVDGSSS